MGTIFEGIDFYGLFKGIKYFLFQGAIPSMTVKEFYPHHTEWVRQVAFYEKLGCLISVAPCSKYSMILHNMTEKESNYIFKVQKVIILCFIIKFYYSLF